MSRRADPQRIDAARRIATLRRRGVVAAWEARAALDGLEGGSAYWEAGWKWISSERSKRRRP